MSNLTRLQAVSSSLDTAITKAENLPDAGGGSGGIDSNETCDISISTDYTYNYFIGWMDSGAGIGYAFGDGATNYGYAFTVKAKCGTVLHVGQAGFYAATATGGEIIGTQYGCGFAFKVPDTPTRCTIDIITD